MEITLLIMENHRKSWNCYLEFLWEPCNNDNVEIKHMASVAIILFRKLIIKALIRLLEDDSDEIACVILPQNQETYKILLSLTVCCTLTLKEPHINCSRRQFQILLLLQNNK